MLCCINVLSIPMPFVGKIIVAIHMRCTLFITCFRPAAVSSSKTREIPVLAIVWKIDTATSRIRSFDKVIWLTRPNSDYMLDYALLITISDRTQSFGLTIAGSCQSDFNLGKTGDIPAFGRVSAASWRVYRPGNTQDTSGRSQSPRDHLAEILEKQQHFAAGNVLHTARSIGISDSQISMTDQMLKLRVGIF